MYNGEIAEVMELSPTATGTHVVLKVAGRQLMRITLATAVRPRTD